MRKLRGFAVFLFVFGMAISLFEKQIISGNAVGSNFLRGFPFLGVFLMVFSAILFFVESLSYRSKIGKGGLDGLLEEIVRGDSVVIFDTSAFLDLLGANKGGVDKASLKKVMNYFQSSKSRQFYLTLGVYAEILQRKENRGWANQIYGMPNFSTISPEGMKLSDLMNFAGAYRNSRENLEDALDSSLRIPRKVFNVAWQYMKLTPKAQMAYVISKFLKGGDFSKDLEATGGLNEKFLKDELKKISWRSHYVFKDEWFENPEKIPRDLRENILRELKSHYAPSKTDTEIVAGAIYMALCGKKVRVTSGDSDLGEVIGYLEYGVDGVDVETGKRVHLNAMFPDNNSSKRISFVNTKKMRNWGV